VRKREIPTSPDPLRPQGGRGIFGHPSGCEISACPCAKSRGPGRGRLRWPPHVQASHALVCLLSRHDKKVRHQTLVRIPQRALHVEGDRPGLVKACCSGRISLAVPQNLPAQGAVGPPSSKVMSFAVDQIQSYPLDFWIRRHSPPGMSSATSVGLAVRTPGHTEVGIKDLVVEWVSLPPPGRAKNSLAKSSSTTCRAARRDLL